MSWILLIFQSTCVPVLSIIWGTTANTEQMMVSYLCKGGGGDGILLLACHFSRLRVSVGCIELIMEELDSLFDVNFL